LVVSLQSLRGPRGTLSPVPEFRPCKAHVEHCTDRGGDNYTLSSDRVIVLSPRCIKGHFGCSHRNLRLVFLETRRLERRCRVATLRTPDGRRRPPKKGHRKVLQHRRVGFTDPGVTVCLRTIYPTRMWRVKQPCSGHKCKGADLQDLSCLRWVLLVND